MPFISSSSACFACSRETRREEDRRNFATSNVRRHVSSNLARVVSFIRPRNSPTFMSRTLSTCNGEAFSSSVFGRRGCLPRLNTEWCCRMNRLGSSWPLRRCSVTSADLNTRASATTSDVYLTVICANVGSTLSAVCFAKREIRCSGNGAPAAFAHTRWSTAPRLILSPSTGTSAVRAPTEVIIDWGTRSRNPYCLSKTAVIRGVLTEEIAALVRGAGNFSPLTPVTTSQLDGMSQIAR
ncbi:hypothetical protein DIPPA_02385 [Diplonema papillatum]|nr:hypothetical protein DIPPA_02385 [Diplonema papillatum]